MAQDLRQIPRRRPYCRSLHWQRRGSDASTHPTQQCLTDQAVSIDVTPGHLVRAGCPQSLGLIQENQQFRMFGARGAPGQRFGDEPHELVQLAHSGKRLEHQVGGLRRLPPIVAPEHVL
ncbi:MAG TPA: hypothetical protein VIJ23_18760 [Mycobacterium sp.]